jgi:hypothetical protein
MIIDAPGLIPAIARGGHEFEANHDGSAVSCRVGSRKIPVDAALDLPALAAHADHFANFQQPIARHRDGAVEGQDSLIGPGRLLQCPPAQQGEQHTLIYVPHV